MSDGDDVINPLENSNSLNAICQQHGVARLWVFGSRARGDHSTASDLDLLVEFRGAHPGLAFFDLEAELSALTGLEVDLRTLPEIGHSIRPRVMSEATLTYVC